MKSHRGGGSGRRGIQAVLLFGIPRKKMSTRDRLMQRMASSRGGARDQKSRARFAGHYGCCLCEYMSHGIAGGGDEKILNDESLELLAKAACVACRRGR